MWGPGNANATTSVDSYVYTVKITPGANKSLDNVTGSIATKHTETCSGPACAPNAYLADCTSQTTFSGVRLSNVVTTVAP